MRIFTEHYQARIGRITPDGTITEFPVKTKKSSPKSIVAAADGNLWFTDLGNNRLGRITPDLWMQTATGKPVGAEPLLEATARALHR